MNCCREHISCQRTQEEEVTDKEKDDKLDSCVTNVTQTTDRIPKDAPQAEVVSEKTNDVTSVSEKTNDVTSVTESPNGVTNVTPKTEIGASVPQKAEDVTNVEPKTEAVTQITEVVESVTLESGVTTSLNPKTTDDVTSEELKSDVDTLLVCGVSPKVNIYCTVGCSVSEVMLSESS